MRHGALLNWYVLKNAEGNYIEEINSSRIKFTDSLTKARLYTRKNHATSSLRNYSGWGRMQKDVSGISVVKVHVLLTEVNE